MLKLQEITNFWGRLFEKMNKAYLLAGVSCFCWASMAPVSKLLFDGLSNMAVLGYGSAIGALVLLAAACVMGKIHILRHYSLLEIGKLLALGTLGYFMYSMFYYYGLLVLPAQTACILNYLWPLFTVLFSIPVLGEQLTLRKGAALLLSFVGVCIIVLVGDSSIGLDWSSVPGYISCLLAAMCYGLFNVLNKRVHGDELISMMLYIGVGAFLAMCLHVREGVVVPNASQWLGLLWLGVFADAVAYACWAMALNSGNTAVVSNIAFVTPVLSVFLCAIILGEKIYSTSIIGLACILAGIAVQAMKK